jgi:hypothetical protein
MQQPWDIKVDARRDALLTQYRHVSPSGPCRRPLGRATGTDQSIAPTTVQQQRKLTRKNERCRLTRRGGMKENEQENDTTSYLIIYSNSAVISHKYGY